MNIMETMKSITDLAKKGMTVELQEKIMELREAVIALKEENLRLRSDNMELKQQVVELSKGELCPKCRRSSWNLVDSIPHPQFGTLGVIQRTYKCSDCGFSEDRTLKGTEES